MTYAGAFGGLLAMMMLGAAGPAAGNPSKGGGKSAPADFFVYVGGTEPHLEGFRFAAAAGTLTSIGQFPSGQRPTYLAFHPSGRNLYAANEISAGAVQAFSIERGTGKLTSQTSRASGGNGAVHVSVHRSGRWLLASNYGGASVSVFPLVANGDLGAMADNKPSAKESHQIVTDPAGKFIFVPCRGPNQVLQYQFDDQAGKLTPNDAATIGSDDPRHIAFHPTGKFAYLVNETPANVVSFNYDATKGTLSLPQKLDLGSGENSGSHVAVTPDGKFVYVGGRRTGRIFGYAVDATTGRLTAAGSTDDGIQVPRDFTITSDGAFVLVANQGLATLTVLRVGANGTLTKVGKGTKTVTQPQAIVVVPVPKP